MRMKHILKDAEFCVEQKCQEWFFSQKWNFSSYSWKTTGGGGAGGAAESGGGRGGCDVTACFVRAERQAAARRSGLWDQGN